MRTIQRLSELFEDWKYFSRQVGLKTASGIILSDLWKLPYRHLCFVIAAHSLLNPLPDLQPKTDLVIRPFEPGDLEFVRQIDRPSEARLCARRLEQGHTGLVGLYQDQFAGYAWGSTDIHTRLERVHPHLEPGDVLCTDSYTCPLYRGRGIQTALTLARFQLFQASGYRRAICYIEIGNGPSLAVWQRKLNSQLIGTIDFMRIGPWYRVHYS